MLNKISRNLKAIKQINKIHLKSSKSLTQITIIKNIKKKIKEIFSRKHYMINKKTLRSDDYTRSKFKDKYEF